MAAESCTPSPHLRGGPLGQRKGLKAPQGLQGTPPGTQPTPALGFPWAESERGKAFPVPGPGQTPRPLPGPGWVGASPPTRAPQMAPLSPSPCPACPPSSPRLLSNRPISQTRSRLGPSLCPLNSTEMGGQLDARWGTPGSCPCDTMWDLGENWAVVLGCWSLALGDAWEAVGSWH